MGKYEADGEDSDVRTKEDKPERKHKHHHHHRSKSNDKSGKEDSSYSKGELSDSQTPHKHKHHHHHHHSKDGKDEASRTKRRHTTSSKHKKSVTDTEASDHKEHHHHHHSLPRGASRESTSSLPSMLVGSRLSTAPDSIRSRRNSRNMGAEEPTYKLTEEPKLDANGSIEDPPRNVDSKVLVIEERVIEHVAVTDSASSPDPVVVEDVAVVIESTPTKVVQDPAPNSPPIKAIAPSSPTPVAVPQPQPVPVTPVIDTTSEKSERSPDAGNPGRIPSPLQSLRENKRFSSLIEPPLPWESRKDKKKSKRALKEHKKNILGETIYKGHPSWLLMRDIQTGLFHSIKTVSTNAVKSAINLFHTPHVQVFPIAPGSTSTFKFKDYCPGAFYKLREHFGINHQDYVASICHNWNEVGTPGKSGSLFFFSQDNQYVLKTIPKREAKLLRTLLPSYYHHMVKNDNSLLTRFMGLHRVKPHKGRQVRFLVMGNLFSGPLKIHQRFDLKGSTVGRELSAEARTKKNPTFKDMDFRRLNKKIPLGPGMREQFLRQLEEDCKFLVSQNIMDYSLLIGIHFKSEEEADSDSSSQDEAESPMTRSTTNLPAFEVPEDSGTHTVKFESAFEREEGGIRGRGEDGAELDEYYCIFLELRLGARLCILERVGVGAGWVLFSARSSQKFSVTKLDIGIIDILMLYTMRKQIEHAYKAVVSRGGEISAVAPEEYAERFIKFISDITA